MTFLYIFIELLSQHNQFYTYLKAGCLGIKLMKVKNNSRFHGEVVSTKFDVVIPAVYILV